MKQNLKGILFYAVFIIATVGIILFVMNSMEGESLVTSDLVEMVRNGEIVEYERDTYNDTMTILTEKGEKINAAEGHAALYTHARSGVHGRAGGRFDHARRG